MFDDHRHARFAKCLGTEGFTLLLLQPGHIRGKAHGFVAGVGREEDPSDQFVELVVVKHAVLSCHHRKVGGGLGKLQEQRKDAFPLD